MVQLAVQVVVALLIQALELVAVQHLVKEILVVTGLRLTQRRVAAVAQALLAPMQPQQSAARVVLVQTPIQLGRLQLGLVLVVFLLAAAAEHLATEQCKRMVVAAAVAKELTTELELGLLV